MRGKVVGRFLYLHVDQLDAVERRRVDAAQRTAKIHAKDYNVVKLSVWGRPRQTTLLRYTGLSDLALPQLVEYWTTTQAKGLTCHRQYRTKTRRPVFHRKEVLGFEPSPSRRKNPRRNPAPRKTKKKRAPRAPKYGTKPSRWTGEDGLNVLSLGLGRDSMTMLLLALEGGLMVDGESLGIGDIDAVAFSDPGHEWPHTYALIPQVQKLADKYGFRFLVLRKPPAEGPHGWKRFLASRKPGDRGLWQDRPWVAASPADATIEDKAASGYYHMRAPVVEDYMRLCRITLPNAPACTINQKIVPINRRLVDDLVGERWGVGHFDYKLDMWEGRRKPNLVMIGIAADEKGRLRGPESRAYQGIDIVESRFPLAEAGIAKRDEQPILERWGFGHVRKSGCIGCHYQGADWFWALTQLNKAGFAQLEEAEAASVAKDIRDGRKPQYLGRAYPGTGLFASSPLRDRVRAWRRDNPQVTADQVLERDIDRCGSGGCGVELVKVIPAAGLKISTKKKARTSAAATPLRWRGYSHGYKAKDGKILLVAARGRKGWTLYVEEKGKRRRVGEASTFRDLKKGWVAMRR
jgi:hypothetical protein